MSLTELRHMLPFLWKEESEGHRAQAYWVKVKGGLESRLVVEIENEDGSVSTARFGIADRAQVEELGWLRKPFRRRPVWGPDGTVSQTNHGSRIPPDE